MFLRTDDCNVLSVRFFRLHNYDYLQPAKVRLHVQRKRVEPNTQLLEFLQLHQLHQRHWQQWGYHTLPVSAIVCYHYAFSLLLHDNLRPRRHGLLRQLHLDRQRIGWLDQHRLQL
jgi:hypothetical protein